MKKYLLIIAALALTSCRQQATAPAETEPDKAIVHALFTDFNRHDWEKMAGLYADTTLMLDPEYGTGYVKKSRQDIIATHQALQNFSPDVKDSIVSIRAVDSIIVAEFVSSGTTTDGTKWTLPICSVITLKNGKIIKDATYYDK